MLRALKASLELSSVAIFLIMMVNAMLLSYLLYADGTLFCEFPQEQDWYVRENVTFVLGNCSVTIRYAVVHCGELRIA